MKEILQLAMVTNEELMAEGISRIGIITLLCATEFAGCGLNTNKAETSYCICIQYDVILSGK